MYWAFIREEMYEFCLKEAYTPHPYTKVDGYIAFKEDLKTMLQYNHERDERSKESRLLSEKDSRTPEEDSRLEHLRLRFREEFESFQDTYRSHDQIRMTLASVFRPNDLRFDQSLASHYMPYVREDADMLDKLIDLIALDGMTEDLRIKWTRPKGPQVADEKAYKPVLSPYPKTTQKRHLPLERLNVHRGSPC